MAGLILTYPRSILVLFSFYSRAIFFVGFVVFAYYSSTICSIFSLVPYYPPPLLLLRVAHFFLHRCVAVTLRVEQ